MIRLPPSVISITPGDIKSYYRRRWEERRAFRMDHQMAAASSAVGDTQSGNERGNPDQPGKVSPENLPHTRIFGTGHIVDVGAPTNLPRSISSTMIQPDFPDIETRLLPYQYREELSSSSSDAAVEAPQDTESPEEYGVRSPIQDPENDAYSTSQHYSPIKDGFYYEGYVESLEDHSSPLTPEDASTPQRQLAGLLQVSEVRESLPRSPLYMSQNVSNSPEGNRSSSLTPRNNPSSLIANTTSILFSQPPRRPPITAYQSTPGRLSRRLLRHQTNDFSAESDERASAVHEQARLVSNSSTASRLDTLPIRTLRDELRGSSLGSSRISSTSSFVDSETEDRNLGRPSEPDSFLQDIASSFSPSPRSELPPPFSSVSRVVSGNGPPALPSHEYPGPAEIARETGDSDVEDFTSNDAGSEPPSSGRNSLLLSARRLLDLYGRTRSPSSHQGSLEHPSPSPSSAAPTTGRRGDRPPRTPFESLQVYDDSLPPSSQPQTPAHLPEARHRSRRHPRFFNPSYTAPVPGSRSTRMGWVVQGQGSGNGSGSGSGRSRPFNARIIDRAYSRSSRLDQHGLLNIVTSPTGMQRPGFRGLYGGQENGDDESNYLAGVQFDEASRRLWDVGGSGIGRR
ncbi:hypothetical protein BP5796_08100 [Coleophoma crateriformis]|uniref:Uncharacterized protein n=1 Tax=Coleophoma crateriformis TaxID=565419 RepID=A0A3D8RDP6_9HELO|nr:hypothetical protein BP5796_08100 [Coleophoma crateriformis]